MAVLVPPLHANILLCRPQASLVVGMQVTVCLLANEEYIVGNQNHLRVSKTQASYKLGSHSNPVTNRVILQRKTNNIYQKRIIWHKFDDNHKKGYKFIGWKKKKKQQHTSPVAAYISP